MSTLQGLQLIHAVETAHQDNAPLSDDHGKPRITNGLKGVKSRSVIPIEPKTILSEIVEYTEGWPVAVNGNLIVASAAGDLAIKKNEKEFFAWLFEHFDVDWQGTPAISKGEFFEYCRSNAKQCIDATLFPHFPIVDEVLYHHRDTQDGDGQALDGFLDFFKPATACDRELIKAFVLTLFWGGPPGSRPAFLITSDDNSSNQGRGYGKTTLLEMCGDLCGGLLMVSQVESVETIRKRIVNQSNIKPRPRIIAIDNVKTRRFSWADLESMITAREISGYALYQGNGAVANYHTFAVTVNGPSVAKDLAQRFVVIKLAEPAFDSSWQSNVLDYLESKKWAIISDIGELLMGEGHPLPTEGTTRFGTWEKGVLCKVANSEQVRQLITQRQGEIDDDDASRSEFGQFLREKFLLSGPTAPGSQISSGVYRIAHDAMHGLFQEFSPDKVGKNAFKGRIERFGMECLRCVCEPGKPRFWLFRLDGQSLTEEHLNKAKLLLKPSMDEDEEF
jgi:hypothetical protein